MRETVREVGRFAEAEGVDCDYARNGVLMVARNALELARLRHEVEQDRAWGLTEADSRMVDRDEMRSRIAVADAVGARFNAHCASLNPAKLVRGLADAAERAGVTIYEQSPAVELAPGRVRTDAGEVRARFVIRATEAYSESIASERRRIVPIRTSMIVTEPLDEGMWRQLGWHGREALLAEHPFLHLQKTVDGRITIGGDDNRVPYRYGSQDTGQGPTSPRIAEQYRGELIGLFPALRDVRIDQTWQGVFGATRSWVPSVGLDRGSGIGWLGGFVGEGVAASNLAGRTLSDLLLGRDTELTRLPWVDLASRRWEPEPLRTVGAGLIWSMRFAGERLEHRTRRPNPLVDLGNRLAGWTGRLG
jgi:glycine/D-amino acid oxidase-like deaminating enzyme